MWRRLQGGGRPAWWLVVIAMALLLALASGLALRFGVLHIRVSDVWPLDLAEPGGWLLDRQLVDLRRDPVLCRKVLAQPHIVASRVPDRAEAAGCGWSNAYRIATAGRASLEVGAVACEVAAGLALWLEHVVQPAARRHFGHSVAGIDHLGAYACRNIRGSPAFANHPSQHATANALDIQGFRLTDGRRVKVAAHWGGETAEGRFLAEVHKGACRYFRVAIGPAYNAAHRDHFHVDRGPWRVCR